MAAHVDSHQHFWRLERGDYGWLTAELEPIHRDFLPDDLRPLLEEAGVARTVAVQAAPTREETQYLLRLAERTDFVAGVVGWVDMEADDAAQAIGELANNPWLKGVRPMIQDIEDPDWMLQPGLDGAFRSLIEHRLCFDALVKPPHLPHLLTLSRRYPELKVVIDHGAKPAIADNGLDGWAAPMAAIAERTGAFCKLSGLLTEAAPDAGHDELEPYMSHLLECFGAERLLWGSDWPVLNLAGDYRKWLAISERFVSRLEERQRRLIMGENCARFYALDRPEGAHGTDARLLLLHPDDNILVCRGQVEAGERIRIEGRAVALADALEVGHKLARGRIAAGERIIKHGASIGSAKTDIEFASHVHLHNIKSDYIASHIRSGVLEDEPPQGGSPT